MNINIKNKKVIITAIGVIVLLVAVCVILFALSGDKEEYRNIQIYSIEGTATVERDGVGKIDAYAGMMMQSGDIVHTCKDSHLYFKMDEDKYALLEPESTVRMESSGTSADSKTVFHLETGSLVSRLDNKLSSDSVYEVNTPNSTMAVRGTVFRIEVTYDENGVSYTNVYVFEGTVECQLVFPEGRKDEDVKAAEGGLKIRVRGDNTVSEYIMDDGTVDYSELPVEVLNFLKIAIEEGVELPISKEELDAIIAGSEIEVSHEHSGGTATCVSPAVCTLDDCGQTYGEKDSANHTGGTEIKGTVAATCVATGYTGDTYCLGCNAKLQIGSATEIDSANHSGGTDIKGTVAATCVETGYTGDTYCLGCNAKLQIGSATEIHSANHSGGTEIRGTVAATCATTGYTGDTHCIGCGGKTANGEELPRLTTHTGGTEIRNAKDATCCDAGYTGDTYCKTCGVNTATGTSIAATGNHPAAVCGTSGHHAHDGKTHASAPCGTAGHCLSDGLDHDIAPCLFVSHRNCDGITHNDLCYDAGYFNIEIVVTDNGGDWSFTINGTTYDKNNGNQDGEQYYFFFQANAGDTIAVTRTGTTGEFYAVSEVMDRISGTDSLGFTLIEGNEEYMITVVIQ